MSYVIIILIVGTIAGFLITYFLNTETSNLNHHSDISISYSILERVAYGVVLGLGLFTWLVYIFSLFLGLKIESIYIPIILLTVFCSLFLSIRWNLFKCSFVNEIWELKADFSKNKSFYYAHIAVFIFFAVIFYRLFYRTIIWHNGDMFIGLPNNYGDLPLHLAYITSFVWGDNIPAQDPSYAGAKLAYPILSDLLSAIFLKLGLDFKKVLFIPGFLLTVAFYGVFYYFVYRLTRKRLAAIIANFIFFFAGGFGFYYFLQDIGNSLNGPCHFLTHLSKDYTKIVSLNYQWITPLSCLNVPQRAYLFGFPVTILIFSILYKGIEKGRQHENINLSAKNSQWKEFLFAGIVAGALPFLHTHSFMAMLMVTIPFGIILWDWRRWFLFFFPAFIMSLPQILYFSTQVESGTFFKFNFGWMSGKENFFWFWLKNTGLFWFVYIGGLVYIFVFKFKKRSGERESESMEDNYSTCSSFLPFSVSPTLRFSLPFLILFLLPNFVLFAPSDWDNIKILIYWFLGSIPVAALGLSFLYDSRRYKVLLRSIFFLTMFFLVFSGGIDVFRYAIAPIYGWKEFDREEIVLAERISNETKPDAVFLTAPTFNHPIFLAGRKTLMGYPGHVWSHGYVNYNEREHDIRKMLKGESGAFESIVEYGVDYVTVGPHERQYGVNKVFFDTNFESVMVTDNYSVYDLSKKIQLTIEKQ